MSSTSEPIRPKVGVGVVIQNSEGKYLLGKRKGKHGAGTWNFPGGHLEWGEAIFTCAMRETMEEVGIEITNLMMGPYTNDFNEQEGTHYVTLYVIADPLSEDARVMEPEKCEEWGWYAATELPSPIFLSTRHYFETIGLIGHSALVK